MAINAHGVKWDGITDAGIPTFMKTPMIEMGSPSIEEEKIAELRDKGVKAAVFGLPFDGTTTSRVGSSLGPRAVRHASCYFGPYYHDYGVYFAEKLKGFDVVEVSPRYDQSELTAMTAAGIIVELLAARAANVTI